MKLYTDWAITKDWFYIKDTEEDVHSATFDEFLLLVTNDTEIFLESGIPKEKFLIPLLEKGAIINIIKSDKIKQKREKQNIEKTDENDVILIRDYVNNNSRVMLSLHSVDDLHNLKLKLIARQHGKLNIFLTNLKNTEKAYLIEYKDNNRYSLIPYLEKEKARIEKRLGFIFSSEIAIFSDIKGIGIVTISNALLFSNPRNFSSVSKYLRYVGFSELTSKTENGKRRINPKRTPFYEMAKGTIMAKDDFWYNFYLKIKEELAKKFPDEKPFVINSKAINRISTLLAKEFYKRIINQKIRQSRL